MDMINIAGGQLAKKVEVSTQTQFSALVSNPAIFTETRNEDFKNLMMSGLQKLASLKPLKVDFKAVAKKEAN